MNQNHANDNDGIEDVKQSRWLGIKRKLGWAFVAVIFLALGFVTLGSLPLEKMIQFNQKLSQLTISFLFILIRWTIFAGVMIYWRNIMRWMADKKQWSTQYLNKMMASRWQGVVFFLTLELIFNNQAYLTLIHY